MKHTITNLLTGVYLLICTSLFGQGLVSYHLLSGPGKNLIGDMYLDDEGNQFLTGIFDDDLFYDGSLIADIQSNQEGFFLLKRDSLGQLLWVTHGYLTGPKIDPQFVETDSSGNVYVSGTMTGGLVIGTSTISASTTDWVLLKFDPMGNLLWGHTGGNASGTDFLEGMAIDQNQDVYLHGVVDNGNVDFGNGVDTTLSSTWHAALLKVSSSGQALWIKVFGENLLVGEALSRANGQEILVTGRIDGTADFGGITSTGPDDNFYLACFDTAGNGLWVNRYTSANLRGLTWKWISWAISMWGPACDPSTAPLGFPPDSL